LLGRSISCVRKRPINHGLNPAVVHTLPR
jgi:hypothetical protein